MGDKEEKLLDSYIINMDYASLYPTPVISGEKYRKEMERLMKLEKRKKLLEYIKNRK